MATVGNALTVQSETFSRDARRCRVIGDSWYSTSIRGLCDPLDQLIAQRCGSWTRWLARRPGIVRSLLLFRFGRRYDLMFTCLALKGTWIVVLLEALLGRGARRLILLEFWPVSNKGPWWRRLRRLPETLTLRCAIGRSMRRGHVLTSWEQKQYAAYFRIPEIRFTFIGWPQSRETDQPPDFTRTRSLIVVSSGRFGCDWPTLFRAARNREWQLTVVCSKSDLQTVRTLAEPVGAKVLSSIPLDEHQRLLESAAVYVISVVEDYISVGQIRAMNAIRAGVPIVATRVIGLVDYLVDNESALLVPPGDHLAMRLAVERLLSDEVTRQKLAARAFEVARERTFERYLADLKSMVQKELEGQ
jgi:glycosyltransferase involved in cell wall biosynthesis